MVTVLRTPARPDPSSTATCTWSLAHEETDCAFRKGRGGRHRHRIRPDCRGHLARDHRGRQRPRHQPEHEVHLDQHFAEVRYRQPATKAPVTRSQDHTSGLQARRDLVCRLLLEKKKKKNKRDILYIKAHTYKH